MKKMMFLPKLTAFLNAHEYIYTVRKYRYSLPDPYVQIDGVGVCSRARVDQVNRKEDLTSYVDKSGFATIDEWWKKIKAFNSGYVGPFYLYKITKEEENA